jgi:hypothetical protein
MELGVNVPTVSQTVPPIQAQPILETSSTTISSPAVSKKKGKPSIVVDTSGKK